MFRLFFFSLLFFSCHAAATGKTLYLYVSEQNRSLQQDVISQGRSGARRSGTKLVVVPLGDQIDTAKLQAGDSVVFVAYAAEWNAKLDMGDLEPLLARKGIKIGVWLVNRGGKPLLPEQLGALENEPNGQAAQQPYFDALSSASSERPAKRVGKAFLEQFY